MANTRAKEADNLITIGTKRAIAGERPRAKRLRAAMPEETAGSKKQGKKLPIDLPKLSRRIESTIPMPAQTQIIKMYLQGFNFREISRQLHRDRNAVARICRAPEVEEKVLELREKVLGMSDKWLESLSYAVDVETTATLAMELLRSFGVVPERVQKMEVARTDDNSRRDEYKYAVATQIGLIAMERNQVFGTELPVEKEELDSRVEKAMKQNQPAMEIKAVEQKSNGG